MRKEFQRVTPEEVGVSSEAVLQFLDRCAMLGIEMHSVMMLRHGKVFAEGWWRPYGPDLLHNMFSFTKSLVSTAIGFAEQEGLLRLDERVSDILPDKISDKTSDNLKAATIADFLCMSCGMETEPMGRGPDWATEFFAHPAPYAPGTHFLYNTAGTNVLTLVLRRRTGAGLFEYLRPRLFEPLGMSEDISCSVMADGTEMGGAGSRLHTEDMARFITFVANKGAWDGKQLLNADWFDRATAAHIGSVGGDSADWSQGYCWQYWRCKPEGVFRADGAFGQFGIVCEKQDAVIILTQCNSDPGVSLQLLWDTILPAMGDDPLPPSPASEELARKLKTLMIRVFPRSRNQRMEQQITGRLYSLDEPVPVSAFFGGNMFDRSASPRLEKLGLEFGEDCFVLLQVDGQLIRQPFCPFGYLKPGEIAGTKYAFGGRWRGPAAFELENRVLEAIGGSRYILRFDDESILVEKDSAGGFAFGGNAAPVRFRG